MAPPKRPFPRPFALHGRCIPSAGPGARARAADRLARSDEVEVSMDLSAGRHAARIWTCDLSTDYVRINAEYTT